MRRLIGLSLVMLATWTQAADVGSVPLAAFVPDGAVLVLRAQDVAGMIARIDDTALGRTIVRGPIADYLLRSGALSELQHNISQATQVLGVCPVQMLLDLAHTEWIVAVYPGATRESFKVASLMRGRPGLDAGACLSPLLAHMTDAGELAYVGAVPIGDVDLNRYRTRKGDEIGSLSYENHTLIVNDAGLALATADLAASIRHDSLMANPRARAACGGLVFESQLLAFLDVPALLKATGANLDAELAEAPWLADAVRAVHGLAAALHFRSDGLDGTIRVAFDEARLPDFLQKMQLQNAAPSPFAPHIPSDGILAGAAARIDLAGLAQAVIARLPEYQRTQVMQQLAGVDAVFLGGASLLNDFLPGIGPDAVLLVTDSDHADAQPAEATLLLQVAPGRTRETLANLMRSLYGMTQFGGNAEQFSMKEGGATLEVAGRVSGMTPTALLTDKTLIVSTSGRVAAEAAGWSAAGTTGESLANVAPPFKGLLAGANLRALGAWIRQHAGMLARRRVREQGIPFDRAKAEIETAGAFLALFDHIMCHADSAPGAVEFRMQIQVAD